MSCLAKENLAHLVKFEKWPRHGTARLMREVIYTIFRTGSVERAGQAGPGNDRTSTISETSSRDFAASMDGAFPKTPHATHKRRKGGGPDPGLAAAPRQLQDPTWDAPSSPHLGVMAVSR